MYIAQMLKSSRKKREAMEAIKKYASNLKQNYDTGTKQTEGLGAELAARAEMNRAGEAAISQRAAMDTPQTSGTLDKVKPHPIKGEKRIPDSDIKEWTKPLGSYKEGTSRVPKTGNYTLHEGEAVIPAEKNPMNASEAMAGISGKKAPRKALKSMHVTATDNKKHIVTHKHHHPEHHPDTTHAMDSPADVGAHIAANAGSIEPQAPAMDESAGAGAGAPGAAAPGM
jgi:hypothetical protein